MNLWLLGLFFVAVVIVATLYLEGYFQPLPKYHFQHFPPSDADHFQTTVAGLSDSWITQGKITDFWVGAEAIYQARKEAIQKAQHLIQFETYIMTPGNRADEFAQILGQKAQEGVRIQLLVDSHGTQSMPDSYWKRLRATGVEVRDFNPFDWRNPARNLRRSHRKLLIIDHQRALIGGAGISDLWDGKMEDKTIAPWLDYEVAIEGKILARLKSLFWQHWLDAGGAVDLNPISAEKTDLSSTELLVTANDSPSFQDSAIRALYQTLILGAKQRLWLASPYFLPNDNTCQMLSDAQNRGVDVKILTMGSYCDKPYVRKAAYERYGKLLHAEIPLYEYQPSMLHAKIALVDDDWFTLGSANFDPRSFFQNDELNVTAKDSSLSPTVEQFFSQALMNSQQVTLRQWKRRSISDRLRGRFWLLFYWQL